MGRFGVIVCVCFLLAQSFPAEAKVLRVGKNQSFQSINQAVAQAEPGDVIEVEAGVYPENVVLSKRVGLRGIGFPSIDARMEGDAVLVTADGVRIEGFVIRNSGRSSLREHCGIRIAECRGVIVENNRFEDNSFGIYLSKSNSCVISGNKVSTSIAETTVLGNAVHCWNSDSLTIRRNLIDGHRDGIYLEFVKDSEITDNQTENCLRYGLHFMFSHRDVYTGNTFRHNGAGVAVMYSKEVNMTGNYFEYNVSEISYGLLLKDISDSVISKNRFVRNSIAIYMDGVNRTELRNNLFQENGLGIRIVASSADNRIVRNNFIGNTFDVATNGQSRNLFEHNFWDKYRGYDLDRDGFGDVPHRPLSVFSMISEYNPLAMLFYHSLTANLLDLSERVFPAVTPEYFADNRPAMKPLPID